MQTIKVKTAKAMSAVASALAVDCVGKSITGKGHWSETYGPWVAVVPISATSAQDARRSAVVFMDH